MKPAAPAQSPSRQPAGIALGARLRELRIQAGLTQSELAGARFSKEYVSQIERGKTRPTRETIDWLAARLGVDAGFLEDGISADERMRVEARLAQAEALAESEQFDEAVEVFERARGSVATLGSPALEVRAICGAWKALVPLGRVREALELLTHAREVTERSGFSDVERAEVLYRMGVCRHLLQSNATALALLDEALNLAERVRDPRAIAHLYFQASILAERQGHWVLARRYAEHAKRYYEEISDRSNVARLLNNLGGLNFLLGKPEGAIAALKEAFATALEVGNDADAAQAVSSLAQVHLRTGEIALAEEQARHALRLLDGRVDYVHEIGSAQLVLGRALLEQDRLDEAEEAFRAAEASFDQFGSASHRAGAWVARGDVAARRGDDRDAARLYRMAAEALQDVQF